MARTLLPQTNPAARHATRNKRSDLSETWPDPSDWKERQRSLSVRAFSKLGIDATRVAEGGIPASQALSVLGSELLAEFPAVRVPGKVIWCNFELARQLGFAVPKSNKLSSELSEQLLNLSLRAVTPGIDLQGQKSIFMYADRYGGDGMGPGLGAGRAGFLPYGNLYVKGIGFTPLFKHNDGDDFAHSHGGVHLDDCLVEAVFGEVNENLFVQGSSRVVAIIDQYKHVTDPSGRRIPIAIVVRTGAQLRPAHLLVRWRSKHVQLAKFVAITRASGQLVTRHDRSTNAELPDVKSTMLRIIDDHARTAAEGFRWRMIHGALSASNMEISGAMLDLPTQSSQPRTAPVLLLEYADSSFGSEHTARALHLAPMYRKLMRNVPLSDWERLNVGLVNFRAEMTEAYNKHLQVELLGAVGLKQDVCRRIQVEHEEITRRFTELILEMAALKNRGPVCVARRLVENVAALDVFNLLAVLSKKFFANPTADHTAFIGDELKPIFKGNQYHRAKKQRVVDALVNRFADSYRELMSVCVGYADAYYGDLKSMQSSITARAAFENQPLECLYSHQLFRELRQAMTEYRSSGNASVIQAAIDQRIDGSLRSVDGLLNQGRSRLLIGGGVELQMRAFEGINYSVRAWNDKKQTRVIHVAIPVERENSYYVTSTRNRRRLTKSQIQSLRYRFTTDGCSTFGEASARLLDDERDGLSINFDLPCQPPLVGRLEGTFHFAGNGNSSRRRRRFDLAGYVFAIPDRQELVGMFRRPNTTLQ